MIGTIDIADALALPGVVAIFTGADVAAGIGRAGHVNPLFHEAMRRPFVADERVHYVGQPVVAIVSETRGAGMDAVDLVNVDYDPLPVVVDPEVSRTRRGAPPPGCRHERRPPGGDADARRLQRLRGGRRGPDRQPAADGGADRGPLRRRLLDRRRTPRALRRLPGSAPDPRLARRGVRPREVAGARRHARRRWRLRCQVADVSRGVGARLLRPCRRSAGALDRDPLGEHDGDAARAQSGAARPHGRHPRRPRHRLPARRRAGCRRLPADGCDPAHDDDADGDRLLPHPQRRVQRRVGRHQHVVDHRLPRCGTAGGGGRHRAHDRPVRHRDRHGSRRRPAAQPRAQVPRAVHDRHRHRVRRRRLPGGPRAGPRRRRLRRPARRAVASSRRRRARSSSASASRSTSRSRPAVRRPSSARSRWARTVISRCVRDRRRSARVTTRRGR